MKGMVVGLVAEKSVHMTGIERLNNVLLLLALFVGLDALGLGVNPDVLNIGTPVGNISIVHLYTLSLVVFSLIVGNYSIFRRPDSLSLPIVVLFLLFFVTVLVSFGRVLFGAPSFTSKELMKNVLRLHTYFYFIPLVLLIKNKRQLSGFITGVFAMSVLAAVIGLYQAATSTSLPASRMLSWTNFQRFLYPANSLLFGSFCALLVLYLIVGLKRRFIPVYLMGVLLLVAMVVPMGRGLLGMLAAVSFGLIVFIPRRKGIGIVKAGVALLFSVGVLICVLPLVGVNMGVLRDRLISAPHDAWYREGTAGFRYLLLRNTWEDVLHNYPLLGRGFDWVSPPDPATYSATAITKTPSNDSGLVSILIMFGLFGIAIYGFLGYRVIKSCITLIHKSMNPKFTALVGGVLALNINAFLGAILGDSFSGQPGTTVLVASWALLYLMLAFQQKERLGG
jgi:hypothetical protein